MKVARMAARLVALLAMKKAAMMAAR